MMTGEDPPLASPAAGRRGGREGGAGREEAGGTDPPPSPSSWFKPRILLASISSVAVTMKGGVRKSKEGKTTREGDKLTSCVEEKLERRLLLQLE